VAVAVCFEVREAVIVAELVEMLDSEGTADGLRCARVDGTGKTLPRLEALDEALRLPEKENDRVSGPDAEASDDGGATTVAAELRLGKGSTEVDPVARTDGV
jgi:hypothetical protein